ncbi:hypothetical protein HCDG_07770 [Histoplasma capsulatum H143]|uniref:Uncharacterized protein n=1 Tax=Ajellomyces capsulatus (strain H143) TaxID=544712 RepID=C6HNI9_AJECH|nr:hypothetical protein HCDG_07770 [Histoplasma capsulatum H143]
MGGNALQLRVTCYHHEGVVLPLVQTPLLIRRGKSERSPDLRPSGANRTSASRSFYCVERNRYLNLSKEKPLMLSLRHKSKELAQYGNACNQPVRGLNIHVVMKGKGKLEIKVKSRPPFWHRCICRITRPFCVNLGLAKPSPAALRLLKPGT